MTSDLLDAADVGIECAAAMRDALGTSRVPKQGDATILGVHCTVEATPLEPRSRFAIVCARPQESAWQLGTCFPALAGAWSDGSLRDGFHLRSLALDHSLWAFIWVHGAGFAEVQGALGAMDLFKTWASGPHGTEVDGLGLRLDDLQPLPPSTHSPQVRGRAFGGPSPLEAAQSGLFLWGHLAAPVIAVGSGAQVIDPTQLQTELKQFLPDFELPLVKARVWYGDLGDHRPPTSSIAKHLIVQVPANGRSYTISGDLKIDNGAVHLSAPMYYSEADSRVGLQGDLLLGGDRRIHVDLDFPLDGDVITATGTYVGGAQHLLGGSGDFGLPGTPPTYGSDTEMGVGLEFSKSARTLTKLSFDLDLRDTSWELIPAPVHLSLTGASIHVTVFDPLASRTTVAEIAAAATFGDPSSDGAVTLLCGGSYPQADLYLQSATDLEVGTWLEEIVGPSPGLHDLDLHDFRIEYNYRSGAFGLDFEVPGPWTLVHNLQLHDVRFRVSGAGTYSGGLAARLTIDKSIDIDLAAVYDGGWQFEGSAARHRPIGLSVLLADLADKFGIDAAQAGPHPALQDVELSDLHVAYDTHTSDFTCSGDTTFDLSGTSVDLRLSVVVTHDADGAAHKTFRGIITVGSQEFTVVFDKPGSADEQLTRISTMLASYQAAAGEELRTSMLSSNEALPDVAVRGAFVARQTASDPKAIDAEPTSKWLLGMSLEAGLDLADVKLPDLPLIGAHGPPKSVKLELQFLVATAAFEESEVAIIGKLGASGSVNIPAQAIPSFAIATTLYADGRVVRLALPVKANPQHTRDNGRPAVIDASAAPPDGSSTVSPTADGTKWVKLQKNFGPIHLERIGLSYKDAKLFISLDGGLTAAGFTISLLGLGVDTPLTEFDPHFHLNGMGLDYQGGAVELGAAFLREEMKDAATGESITAYAGEAVLKTSTLSLSAVGSYMKYRGETSLFIYALLDYPLGGPPFFFVTGLAAGFGYNRRAIIPTIHQVHTYPLVTKAIAGPAADGQKPSLTDELASLEAYIPPDLGEMFLAVGLKFSSFELIDSFALVIAQFGAVNRFDLVGVSHLQIPSKAAGGKPGSLLAEIYMNWKAFFLPAEGSFGLKASLAPGSYIVSVDCHLGGDFAYYAWLLGEHAGDFVYTLGGYHPAFKVPAHYPSAQPLSFTWYLACADLHIIGKMYYALTAHAFMAGGLLDASMSGGFDIGIAGVHYSVHIHIGADFLITWEPYHYDAAVSLAVHAELSAHLLFFSKSFSLDIGGDMHIWGPDFAGEAHIYLKVWRISHTVHLTFGAGPPKLLPVSWEKFRTAFLPKLASGAPDATAICGVSASGGLISEKGGRWIVNAKELSFDTHSPIPSNAASRGPISLVANGRFRDGGLDVTVEADIEEFGIAPMGVWSDHVDSTHAVRITRDGTPADYLFRFEPILKNVPSGMWDQPRFLDGDQEFLTTPEVNPARQLVSGVLSGVRVVPAVTVHPFVSLPVDRRELAYETDLVSNEYRLRHHAPFEASDTSDPWSVVERTILPTSETDSGVKRQAILRELGLEETELRFTHPASLHTLGDPCVERAARP